MRGKAPLRCLSYSLSNTDSPAEYEDAKKIELCSGDAQQVHINVYFRAFLTVVTFKTSRTRIRGERFRTTACLQVLRMTSYVSCLV